MDLHVVPTNKNNRTGGPTTETHLEFLVLRAKFVIKTEPEWILRTLEKDLGQCQLRNIIHVRCNERVHQSHH